MATTGKHTNGTPGQRKTASPKGGRTQGTTTKMPKGAVAGSGAAGVQKNRKT